MDERARTAFTEALKKYNVGDRLSDDELEVLYQYYFSVYHAVSDRPDPAYKLVWQDAFKKMEDLRRCIDARNRNALLAMAR